MVKPYWLIDGSYLYKAMKKIDGFNLDYAKLRNYIEQIVDSPVQAYYFNSTPDPASDAQNKFHTWLKTARPNGPHIRVTLYGLKKMHITCPHCNKKFNREVQKGVDIGIATVALKDIEKYETLILSTGDGDFKDTLKFIAEDSNKKIILVAFRHGLSSDLQQYAEEVLFIDDLLDEVKDTRFIFDPPFEGADAVIDE